METIKLIVVIAFALTMLAALGLIFWRFKASDKGFRRHLQQVFAMTMIVPAIALLALVDVFDKTSAAILMGTMAGYLFGSASAFAEASQADSTKE